MQIVANKLTKKKQKTIDSYQVTFLPTDKQIGEIEKWLFAERKKTGDGCCTIKKGCKLVIVHFDTI